MIRFGSLLASLALVVGCNTVKAPVEGRADPYGAPQVTFASETLRQRTAVLPPSVQRDDAGNLLHVTLPVRNTTNRAMTIDYKATFFDRSGGQIEETGWMPLTLEANTPANVRVNSSTERAADFHIALRQAK